LKKNNLHGALSIDLLADKIKQDPAHFMNVIKRQGGSRDLIDTRENSSQYHHDRKEGYGGNNLRGVSKKDDTIHSKGTFFH
jgi:hypothetical protein